MSYLEENTAWESKINEINQNRLFQISSLDKSSIVAQSASLVSTFFFFFFYCGLRMKTLLQLVFLYSHQQRGHAYLGESPLCVSAT